MLRNKIQGLEATDPDFPQLSLSERRTKLRVRTYIRLRIEAGKASGPAIVTDLSLEGLRLRCPGSLDIGQAVEVFFPEELVSDRVNSVSCTVAWVNSFGTPGRPNFEAGLSFNDSLDEMDSSWVSYILEKLGFDENKTFQKRQYLRAKGRIPARIFTQVEGGTVDCQILNLGIGGALVALDSPLSEESLVHCEMCLWRVLPALRLPCKVLSVREEVSEDERVTHLHSLIFLGIDVAEVRLLGNYVIHLINQSS